MVYGATASENPEAHLTWTLVIPCWILDIPKGRRAVREPPLRRHCGRKSRSAFNLGIGYSVLDIGYSQRPQDGSRTAPAAPLRAKIPKRIPLGHWLFRVGYWIFPKAAGRFANRPCSASASENPEAHSTWTLVIPCWILAIHSCPSFRNLRANRKNVLTDGFIFRKIYSFTKKRTGVIFDGEPELRMGAL